MAHTRAYCDGKLIKEDFPVADVSEFLAMPGAIVWVDYCKPTEADMEELQAELGFHELALSKMRSAAISGRSSITTPATSSWSVTRCRSSRVICERSRSTRSSTRVGSSRCARTRASPSSRCCERWDRSTDLGAHGVGFLVYGLLDVVIDQALHHPRRVRRVLRRRQRERLLGGDTDRARTANWFTMRKVADPVPPARGADRARR